MGGPEGRAFIVGLLLGEDRRAYRPIYARPPPAGSTGNLLPANGPHDGQWLTRIRSTFETARLPVPDRTILKGYPLTRCI